MEKKYEELLHILRLHVFTALHTAIEMQKQTSHSTFWQSEKFSLISLQTSHSLIGTLCFRSAPHHPGDKSF